MDAGSIVEIKMNYGKLVVSLLFVSLFLFGCNRKPLSRTEVIEAKTQCEKANMDYSILIYNDTAQPFDVVCVKKKEAILW